MFGLTTFTKIHANQHQPGACESLVLAWLGAMQQGEAQAAEWCERARWEKQASRFYSEHLARNKLINGTDRKIAVKQSLELKNAVVDGKSALYGQPDVTNFLKAIGPGLPPVWQSVSTRAFEQTSLALLGWRIVADHRADAKARLIQAVNTLGNNPRFYLITLRATRANHAVGFVSTRAQSYLSKIGNLFFYDPNRRFVVKYSTRAAFLPELDMLLDAYQGVLRLTELTRA
jgi:hypothetical protein